MQSLGGYDQYLLYVLCYQLQYTLLITFDKSFIIHRQTYLKLTLYFWIVIIIMFYNH